MFRQNNYDSAFAQYFRPHNMKKNPFDSNNINSNINNHSINTSVFIKNKITPKRTKESDALFAAAFAPETEAPQPPPPPPQQQHQQQSQQRQQPPPQRPQQQPQQQHTTASRAKRFGNTAQTALYDQLKKSRVEERQQAIKNGLIPDPTNPTRLEEAIDFRGTCTGKCPDFEIVERQIQNSLDHLEMDQDGSADPEKVVKAYRRSAAGNEQPLPSDVRTPQALISTLDYLVDDVLSSYPLERCHAFIRDRTRSIRQDFTLQNIRDVNAVHVHERIARFHILCLHEMCEMDESKFSEQQETEQLRKVLLSLIEFYDDLREEGIETENEAEFRAYYIITHIRDQDVARQAQTLPIYLFKHPLMQRALTFYSLAQRNNEIMETSSRRNKPENTEASMNFYSKFFDLIQDENTPFLMACLLESHFADVRKGALKAMNVSFMIKAGGIPAEVVRKVLKYDTLEQLLQEAHLYGIIIDMSMGEPTLSFGQKHYKTKAPVFIEPLSNPSQKKSLLLVEPKKAGRSFQDIINSVAVSPGALKAHQQAEALAAQEQQQAQERRLAEYKQKQLLLEEARAKAEAAEALAAREREKMEAFIEKKKQEERLRKELKLREEQKLKEESERKQAEMERERQQKEYEIQQEKLRQQERERKVEEMRRKALLSQRYNRMAEELIETVIQEEAMVAAIKIKRLRKLLKRKTKPLLDQARGKIAKRNRSALEKQQGYLFNKFITTHNPYSSMNDMNRFQCPEHATPQGILNRIEYCFAAEQYAAETTQETPDAVWRTENFANNIYPRIRDKVMYNNRIEPKQEKTEWQLFISTPDTNSDSATWFKRKFGLDEQVNACVSRYEAFDIAIRMVTPDTHIGAKWSCDAGGIIFDLPPSKYKKTQEEENAYWAECHTRFEVLTSTISQYTQKKLPVVFTYFADSHDTKDTLKSIPARMGLNKNQLADYHFVIMNPSTISTRIVEEVKWLANW